MLNLEENIIYHVVRELNFVFKTKEKPLIIIISSFDSFNFCFFHF
jgi:hypothetical protein